VILLDTHAVIWFVSADKSLGRQSESLAREALAKDELSVSAISFWELALLAAKRRLSVITDVAAQRQIILGGGIKEMPLTGDIALQAAELENLHGDPADRFIAATAIAHRATLMTADRPLLEWRHKTIKRQNASK
jgi:PIN domain nuclease of toxin-antitoxin system